MAKYSNTKAKINEKITTNSVQAITGNILNDVLQTMVDSLGADYQFGGLVQPGSTFTAGEQPVVFLATTPGTYTNFGGLVVADGEVALLVWSGTAWSKQIPDIATRTEVSQLGQYENNPEWVRVITDVNGKVLFGIRADGSIEWGSGVPAPVKDWVNQQIADLSLDEYDKIVAFLGTLIDGQPLSTLLADITTQLAGKANTSDVIAALGLKVDKIVGKGLSTNDFTNEHKELVETQELFLSDEWAEVTTDADGKVLEGIRKSGERVFGLMPPQVSELVEQAESTLDAKIDTVKQEINRPLFQRVSIIGDSISTFAGYSLDPQYPYGDVVSVEDTWWHQVIEGLDGALEQNMSSSGSTASNYNVGFSSRVDKIGTPGLIFIALGTNDSANNIEIGTIDYDAPDYDLSKFAPAYIKGMQDLKASHPTAKVVCLIFKMTDSYANVIKDVAEHYGALAVDLRDCTNGYLIDTVHPNKQGMSNAAAESLGAINYGLIGKANDLNLRTPGLIEDIEGRIEIKTDTNGKIISYRTSEGKLVENVGIKTKSVEAENIDSIQAITDEVLYVERPEFAEMHFTGVLPTDLSPQRTPTTLELDFVVNHKTIFRIPCTLAIQGQGTAAIVHSNYTFEPLNSNYDALSIKFGDLIETDSFHLKGFYTDRTKSVELGGYRWYGDMMMYTGYPYNKVNNIPSNTSITATYTKDIIDIADAKYHPDGFPVAFYINENFYGIYILKLKKTRQNYAMQKSQKKQIFLDAKIDNEHPAPLYVPFDYSCWDLKNPKIKNYEEGMPITDATVMASINHLFEFTNDLDTKWADYADYIVLPHWICFLLFEEIICNLDCQSGNYNLLTWDGEHWSIIPWDIDRSFVQGQDEHIVDFTVNSFLLTDTFWTKFRRYYSDEIRAFYTKLRNNGFLDAGNILSYYKRAVSNVPRELYKQDYEMYGDYKTNCIMSMEVIATLLKNKLDYLDTQWLND